MLVGIALWLPVLAQSVTGDRVALVVGNASYKRIPLTNPVNDANGMAQLLKQAGFQVDAQIDATHDQLQSSVAEFGTRIKDPKVKFALFFYAGHGVQLDWRNHLIPINAKVMSAEDVRQQSLDISVLLSYMGQVKNKSFLVILDACREDPFAGTYRAPVKGLSQFDAPAGSLLAFSTAPGSVARDGEGSNGLYTGHLLRELAVKGAKIEDAFKRVRLNVRMESNGQQIPWESTSMEDDIYLFESTRKQLSDAEQDELLEKEIAAWMRVKSSNDPNRLADFIREYPSGSTSELAQSRLNRLLAAQRSQLPSEKLQKIHWFGNGFLNLSTASEESYTAPMRIAPTPYYLGFDEFRRNYTAGDEFGFSVINGLSKVAVPLKMQVTHVDLDQDRVEYNGGEYVSDTMGNILKNLRGTFDAPRQFYPAELFLGKKWRTRFKQARSGGLSYTFDYKLKVVGKEKIKVPAGTFETYKIEARGFNIELGASIERNIWVSPGINADIAHETIVRLPNRKIGIDQFDRQELVRYSVNKKPAMSPAKIKFATNNVNKVNYLQSASMTP
jgi:hypothetical protein